MEVLTEMKMNEITLKLAQGDITRYPAKAIVNAANKRLEHGGGVAYAIAKACAGDAGKYTEISKKAMREQFGRDYIDHGEVVVTPAMNLEERGIKYVFHTVGPICSGKWDEGLKEKLFKAFLGPLRKAEEMKIDSIAFPAVSAGIYGCELEKVVETFLEAVKSFEGSFVKEIALVIYDRESAERALAVFKSFV
ncbi:MULTISPECIES: [protein ADP-ribosylglutamate] hydrolase [unclassified Archaeoglobus]|jgi:O-acetyl-ADP-ribose deacetylase (regulator of RNase III)|uniref:[protein ADP-ribosylglutamate] hydrolase n=1 Tax=unclassified Archaeoglobus TaxID=2643606 RepID=UPI0025C32555|nr:MULTISPECIES: [protein ADP-ribosylglutamate] hydrolase [unclassified Archaeoglobus]